MEKLDELKDDIKTLHDTLRDQPRERSLVPTVTQMDAPKMRLPLWPFALGMVGAGSSLAAGLIENQRFERAIAQAVAERRVPPSNLHRIESIESQRNRWYWAAGATGTFSVIYLIMRGVSVAPARQASWHLAVESRGAKLTWHWNR